jgi:hypothetical protein
VTLPWYYPSPDEFAARLVAAGFRPISIELIPRPTPLASGMAAWLRTFGGPIFEQLPAGVRDSALEETVDLLRWSLCDRDGKWTADYVRLRFAATIRQT